MSAHAVYGDTRLNATWSRVAWTDASNVAQPVAAYQYRHRKEGGAWSGATDAQAGAGEATSMTRVIAGLDAATWHEVQVRGVNRIAGAAHPGKWSEPGRGRTWGRPDRVERPEAYLTGSAVVVVWEAPDDGGSAVTDYDVRYKTSDSGGWTTHAYSGCGVGSCATTASIAALAKKVQVRAENAVGAGAWSPSAAVRKLKLLRVSYSQASATVEEGKSILVRARLDGAADRPVSVPVTTLGGAGAFRLDNAANNAIAFGLGTAEQTFTLAALQDADSDDEKVTLGFGSLPDGVLLAAPASLVVAIDDDESSNGKPTFSEGVAAARTVAENTAAKGAVGSPVAATDPDGDALAYTLAGTDAALFAIDGATGQVRVGAGTSLDFEGATTSYALTVQASDGKDVSGAAEKTPAVDAAIAVTVNVSDVTEAPSAPDAPTLSPGVGALDVSWDAPDNTGPRIKDYDLNFRPVGETSWADAGHDGAATATALASLSTGRAYEVRVRGASDEGTGGWSPAAAAKTLPRVTLAASPASPTIPADNTAASVTLTATAQSGGGGALTGAWLQGSGASQTVLAENLALKSGKAATRTVSSSAPGARAYGFRVDHALKGHVSRSTETATVAWRPGVALSVDRSSVAEDAGATSVKVTATLSGTSVAATAKTVTVKVAGGTAAADDFAAVADFTITIPASARSASGTFVLTPSFDAVEEGGETVAVGGTAAEGGTALQVTGATVTIGNVTQRKLTVAKPSKGRISGGGIDCGGSKSACAAAFADQAAVTLKAAPDAGHTLGSWTGDCAGRGACALTMDANKAVSATFGTTRALTVTAPTNGKVTGKIGTESVIDCGADCTESVADGTTVALKAAPASGYKFSSWGGACASAASADCSLTLTADRTASATFVKGKAGCSAGSQSWTVGGTSCAAAVIAASSGGTSTATDSGDPTRGSATFKCDDGAWTVQAGSTCAVALGCGSTENSCLPSGVKMTDTADTAATIGQCELTEAEGCRSGTVSDRTDVPLKNGACGAATNQCAAGSYMDQADTNRKNLWRCQGINAQDRWACLGIDGSKNWSCGYGSQSLSCSVSVSAADQSCSDTTPTAKDADCFTCKPCTGANEEPGSDCDCVCKSGYKKHNGACELLPVCGATEPTCDVGVAENTQDTLNPASNKWTCTSAGTTANCESTPADCDDDQTHGLSGGELFCASGCAAGTANWKGDKGSCTGMRDKKPHGVEVTVDDSTLPDTGSATYACNDGTWPSPTASSCSASCKATTLDGCSLTEEEHNETSDGTCGAGYKGSCSYTCGDGAWTHVTQCKPTLTVSPAPELGYVTAVAVSGDGISCGMGNRTDCVMAVDNGKTVEPEATAKGGYEVSSWTGCNAEGTDCSVAVNAPKTVSVKFANTLDAEAGGPYTADYYDLSAIGGGRFYKVTVTASATGGVPPYKYTWQGFSERASATTVYVFQTRADHIRKVTVKDAVNFPKWDKATIHAGTGAGGSKRRHGLFVGSLDRRRPVLGLG